MTLTFDLLTSKSIGRILDSWWVSVWSFMIIGWLQSQLSSGNHFQTTMRHDLDLWPFDPKINRAHPWLMGSKCMKFHDHRWITESVIVRKLVWRTDRLTDRLTDRQTDGQTECKPIVPSGFTGGGLIKSYIKFQLNMSKHVREKCGVLSISSIPSYKSGITPTKTWRKLTTLELDRMFIRRKWHAKFQVNRSKHMGRKCRKLCISSILSSKRGITPTKIDGNWRHLKKWSVLQ